jgi:MFS transporter, DHA2 family, multidrug resistance protein
MARVIDGDSRVTAPASTTEAPPAQTGRSRRATNPYIGILGVFLGAGIATLNSRLISVGLPDLRGALSLGYDEASWIPTALNGAMMFSGVFIVFVNVLYGARRILIPAAGIFTVASAILPFAPKFWVMLALLTIAGLAAGTFYSLTLTFVLTALPKRLIIFGIAAYAADIVFVSNFASAVEGWYADHLSWRWIFWNVAIFTPLMMACVYFGIPRQPPAGPRPNWRGFAYFSLGLSLLYAALDQGERLDWLNSGLIVAMIAAGIFLLAASLIRRMVLPNPTLIISFLNRRNIIILALSIFVFKFVHLATVVLVPGFLGNIQGYRPTETGQALAWVALPMFAVVWLVAVMVIHTNSRLILTLGLTVVAVACWIYSRLDTSWAGSSFKIVELALSAGLACTYVGLVSSIVLEGLEAGALTSAAYAATFSGFMHFIRIFGGQAGTAAMTRFLALREKFHSNLLGLHVQAGAWLTDERLRLLSGGMQPQSAGPEEAHKRALEILTRQVRAQAYTMAIADGFILIGWIAAMYLLLMLFLRPGKITYKDLRKMQ